MLDIYKASAGSGKTFTLALEYIRMLLLDFGKGGRNDHPHSHILAVTFTKKATAEMKERILKELHALAAGEKSEFLPLLLNDKQLHLTEDGIRQRAQYLLTRLLQDYSNFAVSTIDGFFQQVIRRFARELNLPATYELTLDGDEVVQTAIDNLLHRIRTTPASEQTAWLRDFALQNVQDNRKWNPKDDIIRFSKQLLQEELGQQLPLLREFFADKNKLASYRKQLTDIMETYEAANGVPSDYAKKKKNPPDELRIYLTAEVILNNLYPLGLLQDVALEIEQTNQEKNRLPIHEINLLLTWLIDNAEAPFVYEKLGQWFHHFMIDEFQDTSTLQWKNFRPLIEEAEAEQQQNLIVGDIKQSIYRWRNSNWRLLEYDAPDHFPQNRQPVMKRNFRSSPVIVNMNNTLFGLYRDYVADKLNELWDNSDHPQTIRSIYKDENLTQQPVKTTEGYAEWRFFEGKTDEVTEQCLQSLSSTLHDLRQRGKQMKDTAVIVRRREEARLVAEYLSAEGYNVQSADGLLVAGHPAVTILIGLLTAVYHPEQVAPDCVQGLQLRQLLGHELNDNDKQFLLTIRNLPVYEQVQALIGQYRLAALQGAVTYLITFLDTVYHYTMSRTCDTEAFLAYWERRKDKVSVPASVTSDTLQVMTIHSSKGLEFDNVILPFLSWPLARPSRNDILWCQPSQEPFSQLPLVPVRPTALLDNTLFSPDYRQEMLNQYIDNLNLTYVAFTRSKQELYAFGPKAPTLKNGDRKTDNIGHLLSVLYAKHLDDDCLRLGTKPVSLPKENTNEEERTEPTGYIHSPIANRLRLRQQNKETTDLGNRMHEWLGRIRTWDDRQPALEQMLREGLVREEQLPEMQTLFDRFRQMVADRPWFDAGMEVKRETDILTPAGQTYRPDRILLPDDHTAIVIDYKFGEEHKQTYHEQVRNYMALLARMGYNRTEGWLVYVTLGKIEQV